MATTLKMEHEVWLRINPNNKFEVARLEACGGLLVIMNLQKLEYPNHLFMKVVKCVLVHFSHVHD